MRVASLLSRRGPLGGWLPFSAGIESVVKLFTELGVAATSKSEKSNNQDFGLKNREGKGNVVELLIQLRRKSKTGATISTEI